MSRAEPRTGPGVHPGTPLSADQVAQRLENLASGNAIAQARRKVKENMAQLAVDVAGLSLDELVKKTATRHRMIAIWHLAGLPNVEIARAIGYATSDIVRRVLLRPDVQRLIAEITQAQMRRVIDGEFGVQAAAKAAAPKVTKRMIRRAGAYEEDGRVVGEARRDADAIRAGETLLRLSGDLTEQKGNLSVTIINGMSPEERRRFADHGEWPEQYRHIEATLEGQKTIDVTP